MDIKENGFRIVEIIKHKLLGIISSEEEERFDEWLMEEEGNREVWERISHRVEEEPEKWSPFESSVDDAWQQFTLVQQHRNKKMRLYRLVVRYAAVIILLVGMFGAYRIFFREESLVSLTQEESRIAPGVSQAILTLSTGERVEFNHTDIFNLKKDGVLLERETHGLKYLPDADVAGESASGEVLYHTITVPRGGEFDVQLSDGTRVWLNSETELVYPVRFEGNTREVTVRGEAFLEVTPNPEQPFIVRVSDDFSVRVLGTSFNISAYSSDPLIETTLLQGQVEIISAAQRLVLNPNQQGIFDKKEHGLTRKDVDALAFCAWKESKFIFENKSLESIMRIMSRWYNIEVTYAEEDLKNICFTGDLERYIDFSTSLKMLEKVTRIKMDIKDMHVIISRQ